MKILIWKSNTGIAKVLIPSVLIPDLSCWPYIWPTNIVCSPGRPKSHTTTTLRMEFHWLWAFPKEPGSWAPRCLDCHSVWWWWEREWNTKYVRLEASIPCSLRNGSPCSREMNGRFLMAFLGPMLSKHFLLSILASCHAINCLSGKHLLS